MRSNTNDFSRLILSMRESTKFTCQPAVPPLVHHGSCRRGWNGRLYRVQGKEEIFCFAQRLYIIMFNTPMLLKPTLKSPKVWMDIPGFWLWCVTRFALSCLFGLSWFCTGLLSFLQEYVEWTHLVFCLLAVPWFARRWLLVHLPLFAEIQWGHGSLGHPAIVLGINFDGENSVRMLFAINKYLCSRFWWSSNNTYRFSHCSFLAWKAPPHYVLPGLFWLQWDACR